MFAKDPDGYIAKLSKEDQAAVKANSECPLTKEPVNTSLFTEHEGRKVYFCCENCLGQFTKEHSTKKSS
jgi:YHS domain-containing protein